MKHICLFENFERKIYTLGELYNIGKWIKEFNLKLDQKSEDEKVDIFHKMEDIFDEDTIEIIDSMYSDDKLHYHQNGRTVGTGGIDTYPFIENFEEIKSKAEALL